MIKKYNDFNKYPLVRHLTSYETAISILENNNIYSRNYLSSILHILDEEIIINENLLSDDKWWYERHLTEMKLFNTSDLIYCTPDWFKTYEYATGHGPVMIYFNEKIYDDFDITFSELDSHSDRLVSKIYTKNELVKIYENILNNSNDSLTEKLLENLDKTNEGAYFNTSKGIEYIEEGKLYNKYSEIQIHAEKISIDYIDKIILTDKYFVEKDTDEYYKGKLLKMINNI